MSVGSRVGKGFQKKGRSRGAIHLTQIKMYNWCAVKRALTICPMYLTRSPMCLGQPIDFQQAQTLAACARLLWAEHSHTQASPMFSAVKLGQRMDICGTSSLLVPYMFALFPLRSSWQIRLPKYLIQLQRNLHHLIPRHCFTG